MRYSASEKFEIIELVQQSSLSMGAAHVLRWGLEPRSERLHDLQKQTACLVRILGSLSRLGQLGHLPSMLDRLSRSFTMREQGKRLGILHRHRF
jgi:hypothetical protein